MNDAGLAMRKVDMSYRQFLQEQPLRLLRRFQVSTLGKAVLELGCCRKLNRICIGWVLRLQSR